MSLIILPDTFHISEEESVYLLFEAGAQELASFKSFYAQHSDILFSLYLHPQLTAYQDYGPWLLEVKELTQLKTYLNSLPGCIAILTSTLPLSSVAIQLSRGCTIVTPDGRSELVRFYASHVIELLVQCVNEPWYNWLFREISQWWVPGETQWQPLVIMPVVWDMFSNPVVRLNRAIWQQITDKPAVTATLNEWQKMPVSRQYPACTQRLMVIKALKKSEEAGLSSPQDQKLYALYYLSGGRDVLESDALTAALANVVQGRETLADLLLRYAELAN